MAVVTNLFITTGAESLLIDTIPAVPDPTQILASWATIHSGGIILTTNGLIDTNAVPSDMDGMPAGSAVGVALVAGVTNAFVITRGEFDVLLTNSSGELLNTRFEVKIMRNTNDFRALFHQDMAVAEYTTNSTNLTLTPISGTANSNLYSLSVSFPPCVWAAVRVLSIRTEPLDFDLPFAQLQWLMATNGATAPATYTTDQTQTNLVAQTNVPAMRLWGMPVSAVGLAARTCLTPGALHLFAIPGTVITTSTNNSASGPFTDAIWPDERGFGNVDMSQAPAGFYGLRVDGDL